MIETVLSPGVYSEEINQSYVAPPANPGGLAVVGPTEKGAAYIPTDVSSFSQFSAAFGMDTANSYVPQTVYNYLQAGDNVKVTRVLGNGGWSFSSTKKLAAITSGSVILSVIHPSQNDTPVTANLNSSSIAGTLSSFNLILSGTNVSKTTSGSFSAASSNYITKVLGTDQSFQTGSGFPLLNFGTYAATLSGSSAVTMSLTAAPCTFSSSYAEGYDAGSTPWVTSATSVRLFKLVHTSHGFKTNKDVKVGITGINVNADSTVYTTFNVIVRAWNDTERTPSILEQYTAVTLDPNASNYIGAVIGDKYQEYDSSTGKIVEHGDYDNTSNYIRVVLADAVANDAIHPNTAPAGHEALYETVAGFTGFNLPAVTYVASNTGSAALSGFDYYNADNINYLNPVPTEAAVGLNTAFSLAANDNKFVLPFQGGTDGMSYSVIKKIGSKIATDGTNVYGFDLSSASTSGTAAYRKAIDILGNKERYSFNTLVTPGVFIQYHNAVCSYATTMVESRTDAIYPVDLCEMNANIATAKATVVGLDSTYSAVYYPWIQVKDIGTGKKVYMPATVMVGQAIAYNDKVAAPWFAVAGTGRGTLGGAIDTKNRLTMAEVGTLYAANINCIIKKVNTGVVIWGNATTQVVTTGLSSLSVRRLLIELKNFIEGVATGLVFEQNTNATRNTFLRQVNPYLENVQEKQGVYAYKVTMDETNNSNADIDRLTLKGLIQIQPTKDVEFILLSFNLTPTGATFA
jgi:hypothetical protein